MNKLGKSSAGSFDTMGTSSHFEQREFCQADTVCTDPCKQTTLQSHNRKAKAYIVVQNLYFQKLLVPLHLSSEDRK